MSPIRIKNVQKLFRSDKIGVYQLRRQIISMKRFRARFRLLILLMLFWAAGAAFGEISIAMPGITSLVKEDSSGIYQRIMAKALENLDVEVKQDFFPFKRALKFFDESRVGCIYAFTHVMEERWGEENLVVSFPLGAFSYYMFTPRGTTALTSTDQLKNRIVAGVIGHDAYYGPSIADKAELQYANSDQQNVELLKLGRVDVIIAALPDIRPFLRGLTFSAAHPLFRGYDRITCHRTPETERFIASLSQELLRLKEDGTYRKIAGRLYVDFPAHGGIRRY